MFYRNSFILGILIVVLLSSCRVNKNIAYFKDIPDTLSSNRSVLLRSFEDPKIQANDILQVSILTLDPAANQILNNSNVSSFAVQPGSPSGAPAQAITGFLVDGAGFIELPLIGKLQVAGMTTAAVRDSVHNRVELYYNNPVVNVRLANFSVTVLGEVLKPSTYIVPNEKVSVLDALGMAGDLTIFGKRENVLLVRDSANHKTFTRLNLNSSSLVSSPYFYLKQGDILYVEPNGSKVASTDAVKARNYTLLASVLTVLITIATRIW